MGYAGHDERRNRILLAAAELLTDSGMERLSVRSVAEAAGIGMGTLRHYFPNQRSLHQALTLKLIDNRIEDFDIFDPQSPAADRLEHCVLQFVPTSGASTSLLDVWSGMYRFGLDSEGAPFYREFLTTSTVRSRQRIREWLEVLASEGSVLLSDVRIRALELSALIAGVCLEMVTPASEMTVEDATSIVRRAARAIPTESKQHDKPAEKSSRER